MFNFDNWFSGFVDGEGSFYVGFWKHPKMKYGIVLRPEFAITMHKKESPLLESVKKRLGMGDVIYKENSTQFRVTRHRDLVKLIDFFERNPLLSYKSNDFQNWKESVRIVSSKTHLDLNDIRKLLGIRDKMNKVGRKGEKGRTSKEIEEIVLNHIKTRGGVNG